MSLFDFFVNFGSKLGANKKDAKMQYKINNLADSLKTTNPSMSTVTINVNRDLNIDSALSVLQTTKPKLSKVTTYRTINPEHGKVFLRKGLQIHHTKAFKLKYNGILAQTESKIIYAVTGSGDNNNWQNIKHIPMYKIDKGFEALVSCEDSNDNNNENSEENNQNNYINFAFKDALNNWDNNSGNNYTFNVELLKGKNDNK